MNDFELEPNSLAFELNDDEYDALWMLSEHDETDEPLSLEQEQAAAKAEQELTQKAWEQHYQRKIEPKLSAAQKVLTSAGYSVQVSENEDYARFEVQIFDTEPRAWLPQVSVAYDGSKNDTGACYDVIAELLSAHGWFHD